MRGIDRLRSQLVAALAEHLRSREARPRVPEAGILLWNAFLELDSTRTFGSNGPRPITFEEIRAWCDLTGYRLPPHHVQILRAMDATLLERFSEEVKRREGEKAQGAKSKRKMTPALFDARFKSR